VVVDKRRSAKLNRMVLYLVLALVCPLLSACDEPPPIRQVSEFSKEQANGLRLMILNGDDGNAAEALGLIVNSGKIEVIKVNTIYSNGGYLRLAEVYYKEKK
jgi:hypothetical protein